MENKELDLAVNETINTSEGEIPEVETMSEVRNVQPEIVQAEVMQTTTVTKNGAINKIGNIAIASLVVAGIVGVGTYTVKGCKFLGRKFKAIYASRKSKKDNDDTDDKETNVTAEDEPVID